LTARGGLAGWPNPTHPRPEHRRWNGG
jgi:hypothetical protein